jgi:putative tryptophan/tyrosine transport system substrate-binding protein
MKRREFITLLGGAAAAWPLTAHAQQPAMPVIGFLSSRSPGESKHLVDAFRAGLQTLGYVEGQNVAIHFRCAEGQYDRLPAMAAELVRENVAVLATLGGEPSALSAKAATSTIPIVFSLGGDPVKVGLVASLNRPGGNATGVSLLTFAPEAKRPVVTNAADPVFAKLVLEQVELASRITGLEIQPISVRGPEELDAAFGTMVRERAEAVVIQGSLSTKRVADLALEHRLPAASLSRSFADVGGLMSYGADGPALFRRSALFVHKILQGNKPTDMPVEQPTKFELVVNLKTANALGIDVPLFFQQRADAVIE